MGEERDQRAELLDHADVADRKAMRLAGEVQRLTRYAERMRASAELARRFAFLEEVVTLPSVRSVTVYRRRDGGDRYGVQVNEQRIEDLAASDVRDAIAKLAGLTVGVKP